MYDKPDVYRNYKRQTTQSPTPQIQIQTSTSLPLTTTTHINECLLQPTKYHNQECISTSPSIFITKQQTENSSKLLNDQNFSTRQKTYKEIYLLKMFKKIFYLKFSNLILLNFLIFLNIYYLIYFLIDLYILIMYKKNFIQSQQTTQWIIIAFEFVCVLVYIFLLCIYMFKKDDQQLNKQSIFTGHKNEYTANQNKNTNAATTHNRLYTSTISSFTSFRSPLQHMMQQQPTVAEAPATTATTTNETSSLYSSKSNKSDFSLFGFKGYLSNNKILKFFFNFKNFLTSITLILFLLHFLLNKIIFNTNFYYQQLVVVESSNKTATNGAMMRNQYYDTDGVVDILLFTLLLYVFNVIRPIFVLLFSILLIIIQCSFVIVHNTPYTSTSTISNFEFFSQFVVNILLYTCSNLIGLAMNHYYHKRVKENFSTYYEVLKKRSQLYLDCLKLETLLSNWSSYMTKTASDCVRDDSFTDVNSSMLLSEPQHKQGYKQLCFSKNDSNLTEQIKIQTQNSCIIYINLNALNETTQMHTTHELITFLDIFYPQIEQISKKYECDYMMSDSEDIVIANSCIDTKHSALQSIMCSLEICKFIEHVCKVSKWNIEYRIGIHFDELVYVLNQSTTTKPESELHIVNENEESMNLKCDMSSQKTSTTIVYVYGSMIEYARKLKESCLLNQMRISKTVKEQLTSQIISKYNLHLQEITKTYSNMNEAVYLLAQTNVQNEPYTILPITNITREKLRSIQAKYNLENQQKTFFEQQILTILNNSNLKNKTKTKKFKNFLIDYEIEAANNQSANTNSNFIDEYSTMNTYTNTSEFLKSNRFMFQNNLNFFTLNYKSARLNKFYWLNEIVSKDHILRSFFILTLLISVLFPFQFILTPRTILSYVHVIVLTICLIALLLLTIYHYKRANLHGTNQNLSSAPQTFDDFFLLSNNAIKNNTMLIQSSIQNSQVYSKSFSQYRQLRKNLHHSYVLAVCKLILKLLIVVFIIENYFINFVDPCFQFLNFNNTNPEFVWSQLYCQTKPLGLTLIVIIPFLCASFAIYSVYWFIKFIFLTTILIGQIVYILKLQLNDKYLDGLVKYKVIVQLVLFYVFLCIMSYAYEAVFKLIFLIIDKENESNTYHLSTKRHLNKQLRQHLPKRAINFYLFNRDASMSHYYLCSPNIAILNVSLSFMETNRSNLNECKYHLALQNFINQILSKERFESVFVKQTIGGSFIATCGFQDNPNQINNEAVSLNLLIEFLFAIQEKINELNDRLKMECSISSSLNIGQVTEALIHTNKPTINSWGEGMLISNHLVSQSDVNHCIVTEEIYNLLKDKYLYRPAGSFLIEYSTQFKQQQQQQTAQYISIYYLLGRIIGDNIFKGRYSLPKVVKSLYLRNSEHFIEDSGDFSESKNRLNLEPFNRVSKVKHFKSSVSTDSGHSSSTVRNNNLHIQHTSKLMQSPVHFTRLNNNFTPNSEFINEMTLYENEEHTIASRSDKSTKQRDNANCIFLTQDMIVGGGAVVCDETDNQRAEDIKEQSSKSSSRRSQNQRHAPLVYPETWYDAEETDLFDKDDSIQQETSNDCDDVSQLEEELVQLNEGLSHANNINQYEDMLYDYLSHHNEDFIKGWLSEQYSLFLKAYELDEQRYVQQQSSQRQQQYYSTQNHVDYIYGTNRKPNGGHTKPMYGNSRHYYQSSSPQSTNPSSPLFFQKRLKQHHSRNFVKKRGNGLNLRSRPPLPSHMQQQVYYNVQNSKYNRNIETTSNTSDCDCEDYAYEQPKPINFKLNPIDLDGMKRNYVSSSEFSINDGCVGDDDETADEHMANIQKAFLPLTKRLKAAAAAAAAAETACSANGHGSKDNSEILFIDEKIAKKEQQAELQRRLPPPVPVSGYNSNKISDRGKALLNQYMNLKASMNGGSAASSNHSSLMKHYHHQHQQNLGGRNSRSKTLNFKQRYYSWLLRSPANSLTNMSRNQPQHSKSANSAVMMNSLLAGVNVNNDSMNSLNSNLNRAPSSHYNDSEYDNYRPGLTSDDEAAALNHLTSKNRIWSTDDEGETCHGTNNATSTSTANLNQSRSLIAELIEQQTQDFCEIIDLYKDDELEEHDELTQLVAARQDNLMSTITEMSIDTDKDNKSEIDASILH